MKTILRKYQGFTVIEITVFLLAAAIVLPALLLPFVEGTRKLNEPTTLATMAFLAQEAMEQNLSKEYDDIKNWASSEFVGFPGYFNEGSVVFVDPADFSAETATDCDYKRLTVTVRHGETSPKELTTLIARKFEGIEQ